MINFIILKVENICNRNFCELLLRHYYYDIEPRKVGQRADIVDVECQNDGKSGRED